MATFLLEAINVLPYLWVETVKCDSYIDNKVPHKSVIGVTTFKSLTGNNPNVSHLMVFGSKAWTRIPTDKRKSFQAQSSECILLGYVYDSKSYKLMDIETKKCFIEYSVQFEEHEVHDPHPSKEGIITSSNTFADNDVFTNISNSESKE